MGAADFEGHPFSYIYICSFSQTDWAIGKLELLQTKDHAKDKREYVYSLEAQHGFQSMTLTRDLFMCAVFEHYFISTDKHLEHLLEKYF